MNGAYQMKLLKPSTRMVMPVNWIASANEQLNSSSKYGNMGASARGPKPWKNVTAVEAVMVEAFHHVLQLSGSAGSSLGCGTRTLWTPVPARTK